MIQTDTKSYKIRAAVSHLVTRAPDERLDDDHGAVQECAIPRQEVHYSSSREAPPPNLLDLSREGQREVEPQKSFIIAYQRDIGVPVCAPHLPAEAIIL